MWRNSVSSEETEFLKASDERNAIMDNLQRAMSDAEWERRAAEEPSTNASTNSRIAAQFSTMLPEATSEQQSLGWTIETSFLRAVKAGVNERGEWASEDQIEATLLVACDLLRIMRV